MYSLKWYQGAQEFYRYTPTAPQPVQIFDPPTLDVDVSIDVVSEGEGRRDTDREIDR